MSEHATIQIQKIQELEQQLLQSQAREEKLRDALLFYSDGKHSVLLHGSIDWKGERARLELHGFTYVGEYSSGGEEYVEDGRIAQNALDQTASDSTALDELKAKVRKEAFKEVKMAQA